MTAGESGSSFAAATTGRWAAISRSWWTRSAALPEEQFVLDVEILVPVDGGYDFAALLARLHPAATRVERLSKRSPATLVARQHCPSRLGALFAAALSDVQSVAGLSPG